MQDKPPSLASVAYLTDPVIGLGLVEASKERDAEYEANRTQYDGVPPVYASEAANCSRRIAYRLAGYEREPFDNIGRHVTQIGELIHRELQRKHPEERVEVRFNIGGEEEGEPVVVTGRADLVAERNEDEDMVVDIKSTAAYGYKQRIDGEGPSPSDMLQVGIGMFALNVDWGRVVYVAKEKLDNRKTAQLGLADDDDLRIVAEFEFAWADIEPWVDRELTRMARISELIAESATVNDDETITYSPHLVPRAKPFDMPKGARLDPRDSSWVVYNGNTPAPEDGQGAIWNGKFCAFCPFQQQCIADMEAGA